MIAETVYSPHSSGRGSRKPQLIVLHIADGTYEGTKAWFGSSASQVSAHFVVAKDGRICQCVPLEQAAWCNGTSADRSDPRHASHSTVELVRQLGGNANQYSVSAELEGRYAETKGALTGPQLAATARLVLHIRREVERLYRHTIPLDRRYIVGHNEITPKTRPNCPGEKFPWVELMALLHKGQGEAPEPLLYRVQVGAFRERSAAEAFLRKVRKMGLDAFLAQGNGESRLE